MSVSGSGIAVYAMRFLDGPAYEWGRPDVGPVAEFRRAVEAGGTIDEMCERVMEWTRRDFEQAYQAFCELRLLNTRVCLEPCSHDPSVS